MSEDNAITLQMFVNPQWTAADLQSASELLAEQFRDAVLDRFPLMELP